MDRDERVSSAVKTTLAEMPVSDKEKRKEQRKKAKLRQERKENRRRNATATDDDEDDEDGDGNGNASMSGMGKTSTKNSAEKGADVVIVPKTQPSLVPAVHDERKYDSDNEDYDSHDRAVTLALGTLMLRKSRRKALVDASYNRFAWNDDKDLPSWFVDDELKHNKPQLPVPDALVNQVNLLNGVNIILLSVFFEDNII